MVVSARKVTPELAAALDHIRPVIEAGTQPNGFVVRRLALIALADPGHTRDLWAQTRRYAISEWGHPIWANRILLDRALAGH